MCLVEVFRRLHGDDSPLLLSLAWSEEHEKGLDCKQFVLKEKHTDAVEVLLKSFYSFLFTESFIL